MTSCIHPFDELPFFYYKRVIAAIYSFKFTAFLQNRNEILTIISNEILTIIIIPPWFKACIYWKKVCYMTASFPAIHFFYDSVIISREHLKQSMCQGNRLYFTILFATIHYSKGSAVDSRKRWRVCLFEEKNCSPTVLKMPIYFTEQVAIIFVWKVVKCTKSLTEIPFFHGEPA